VIETALEVIRTGRPRMVRVDLTEDLLSWSPAVCGGIMNVFVESLHREAGGEKGPARKLHAADPRRPDE